MPHTWERRDVQAELTAEGKRQGENLYETERVLGPAQLRPLKTTCLTMSLASGVKLHTQLGPSQLAGTMSRTAAVVVPHDQKS
jgi:hypothetical protein